MRQFIFLILMAGLLGGIAALPAGATIVHLDGVANAGWYADDLTKAHLYIANPDAPGTYYYQWSYDPSDPTPLWGSRQELAADLLDGVMVNGTPVGNWRVESAGDVFGNPSAPVWKAVNLTAGSYVLRLTADSRAYQLNEFLWPNEAPGSEVWNAYVQMYAIYADSTTGGFTFGDWSLNKGSEAEVLDYYRQAVDGLIINLPQAALLYFYINDYNAVDNGASVTLELTQNVVVPVPPTLFLVASGLALLGLRRRR